MSCNLDLQRAEHRTPKLAIQDLEASACYSNRRPDFGTEAYLLTFRKEIESLFLDDRVKPGFDDLIAVRDTKPRLEGAFTLDAKCPGSTTPKLPTVPYVHDGGTNGLLYPDLAFTKDLRRPIRMNKLATTCALQGTQDTTTLSR